MPSPKDHRRVRATEIRAIQIRAIRIRAMEIRPILIRAMGSRPTWGHLRRALMATTLFTRTPAHPTGTMDQAGSQAGSLLAPGRGALAVVGAASPADVALADAATMEAGRPFPGAGDSAVGSVTVTPDGLSAAVVPSVGADMASAAADAPSAGVDVPSVAADMPPEAVDLGAEAEGVMVVGAGRFHHQLEVLAADSTRCRPLCFRSRRQPVGRAQALCDLWGFFRTRPSQETGTSAMPSLRAPEQGLFVVRAIASESIVARHPRGPQKRKSAPIVPS